MEVKIKKLSENAIIPTRGSDQAAGYDLYACLSSAVVQIMPQTNQMISTGLSIEIPEGYFGAIFARSGLASKKGLRPANCVGVIDSDYRGEIKVCLYNDNSIVNTIVSGERIAQLVLLPYEPIDFVEANELNETDRGDGGFGSTGTK